MNASTIGSWIRHLGQTHEYLLSESLIPDDELVGVFPGDDEVYLEPIAGVSMSFWAETERFESLCITLLKSTPSTVEYQGTLPEPYALRMNQSDIRALLGEPLEYSGPVHMPEPLGQTGGWEYYQLDSKIHPNVRLQFQYLESMDVNAIVFTLADKGHA